MDRQAGGLVDHQHQPVAMEHAGLDFLRGQFGNFGQAFETFAHGAKPLTHPGMSDTTPEKTKLSWWRRLSSGLKRTSSSLGTAVADLVTKRKLDRAMLEDIEDVLLRADLGTEVAARIAAAVGHGRYDKAITADDVKSVVATEVEKVLAPVAKPLVIDEAQKPFVILVVGVNGSGKTTTIGKLAAKLSAEGRKVMLAAGDTFRAAAIEQLKIWGERTKSPVIAGAQGSDSASLAFNALTAAREGKLDVLLVDTAGRLQNKAELMNELEKVVRVIRKVDASAPHAVLLVLDATVGQNALSQVEAFHRTAGVTGLVMTKLDGTARGGILVALAEKHKLPVHFIGVGEGVDDLASRHFTARDLLAREAIAGILNHRSGWTRRWTRHAASFVQARDRTRAAAGFLRRQRQVRPVRRHRRLHGGDRGRDHRILCGDAARAADGAGHRRRRHRVRHADAGAARRDLHQGQAHHHLRPVRRDPRRRAVVRPLLHRDHVRPDVQPDAAGLAHPHGALGAVLFRRWRS